MSLDLINKLVNNTKENKFVQNFIKELSDYLSKENKTTINTNVQEDISSLREENCLYQVIDKGRNGIYLQNTKNNKVFEETELPEEIKDKIQNDYILRYKDGKYIVEQDLTEEFFNRMVGIEKYEEIQNDFIEKSNISKINPDTRFNVVSRKKDYTILGYGNKNENQIEVPNILLPYFIDEDTILYYKDEKFEKA